MPSPPVGATGKQQSVSAAAAKAADIESQGEKVSTHFSGNAPKVSAATPANVTDFGKYKSLRDKDVAPKVSTHFDRKRWKRSRVKNGYLIRRIKGYDISEDEYGVSYLYVITRNPKKKTSADFSIYEHAGFFTWHTLEVSGRVVPEGKNDRKRLNGNRNRAS